ncbi:glycosyltransferase [Hwangdonia sp.]|uniref:glycosyltransferase n=1 Tax=Hwangdonia sp. TaxID=1883432 RepID=UPI003AB63929
MKPKKIALVGFHLSGGGTARVMANLSESFHDKGIELHIIIIHDELGYDYSGTLYNLGKLKSEPNTVFNKIKRLIHLRSYVKQNDFDFVIDFRFRKRIIQEYLISRLVYNQKKTIYTIHSSQLAIYLPKSKYWANVIYGKAYKIIAITESMKNLVETIYPFLDNVGMVYNPIILNKIKEKSIEALEINFEYIIGVGQFDTDQKQFDKLIEAYSKSILPQTRIKLVILGRGKKKSELEAIAKKLNVDENVQFLGFKENPYKYMANARFFVLSSWHEGHPMVLIEALACGTPVVSFDCPTGPKEVVNHSDNGLLIENQNIDALINGMNIMLTNESLYSHCKSNALKSVEKFSVKQIGKQWLKLMKIN